MNSFSKKILSFYFSVDSARDRKIFFLWKYSELAAGLFYFGERILLKKAPTH